jgi:hypothetical protein
MEFLTLLLIYIFIAGNGGMYTQTELVAVETRIIYGSVTIRYYYIVYILHLNHIDTHMYVYICIYIYLHSIFLQLLEASL